MGKKRLLLLFFTFWNAWFLTQCERYADHTLYTNNSWRVVKRMMEMHVMGSDEYLLSRASLKNNALHLNRYYGHQHVVYKTPQEWTEWSFTANIERDSSLTVLLSRTAELNVYLRLSRKPHWPSQLFTQSQKDFKETAIFDFPLSDHSEHKVKIKKQNHELKILIDDKSYVTPNIISKLGEWGWIGDLPNKSVSVDTVRQLTPQGTLLEDFSPKIDFRTTFLRWFGVLFILFLSLHFIFKDWSLKIAMIFASVLPLLYCADYFFWKNLEINSLTHRIETPFNNTIAESNTPALIAEKIRYSFFRFFGLIQQVSHDTLEARGYMEPSIYFGPWACTDRCFLIKDKNESRTLFSPKTQNTRRILFIGTSQTFGVGASQLEKTFVALLHQQLKKKYPKTHFEFLNISVCGSMAKDMFDLFKTNYTWFSPDKIIINLSGNDFKSDFETPVRDFVKEFPQAVLVAEPTANSLKPIKNHKILRSLAQSENLPFVDLHQHLIDTKRNSDALFWWDVIHFTDMGHYNVALWLAEQNFWNQ